MFVTIPLKLYIKKHGLIALDIASYQPATDSQKDHNGEHALKRKIPKHHQTNATRL